MRWPDLFFKRRKPNPAPEPASVSAPALTEAEKKKEQENSRIAAEKADSLRALTESGSAPAPLRTAKDSPLAGSFPASANPADVKTSRIDMPPLRGDAGVTRSGAVSLRQRAKLTDDALVPPKTNDALKPGESSSPEANSTPAAVVPAAFPIAVETGSLLEKPVEGKNEAPSMPSETKSEISVASEVKPSAVTPSPVQEPGSGKTSATPPSPETAPRDTTRVRLGETTSGVSNAPIDHGKPLSDLRGKQEFVLANGERILGHVLSETPQTIYIDHGTLGVLTLPKSEIAKKPIEVILINGDRIVGDLIAETPECMYIRHASLGMLTVPHNQRSTRVVEAIMKDGDRILGEVLAETGNFTVIRSATLGTVAVQHDQVAMLNRKIEQMQLRMLPPSSPALDDKSKT